MDTAQDHNSIVQNLLNGNLLYPKARHKKTTTIEKVQEQVGWPLIFQKAKQKQDLKGASHRPKAAPTINFENYAKIAARDPNKINAGNTTHKSKLAGGICWLICIC